MDRTRRSQNGVGGLLPILSPAALGLLALGTALDILSAGQPGVLAWLAFWIVVAGVAAGTWCAVFSLFDWIFFARLGEAGVCGLDGFACAVGVGLYGLGALLRVDTTAHMAPASALALEVAGAALLGTKAWIGRELAAWLDERR
jgi:hypothetical protein